MIEFAPHIHARDRCMVIEYQLRQIERKRDWHQNPRKVNRRSSLMAQLEAERGKLGWSGE